jgi:retron-type reverse transcriptase
VKFPWATHLKQVFHGKEGGIPVKVQHSTTPYSEKRTDRNHTSQWNSIDWKAIKLRVNRLQTRIAKATHNENWNLFKRLTYLLTHSYSVKLLAVRIVTQNHGKRTAGVDGQLWTTASEKMHAALSLSDQHYRAHPLRRIYIPKPGKSTKRPLSIPTMYDRAMQALYALALQPVAETTADTRSFGFRLFKCAQDASSYAFRCLCQAFLAIRGLELSPEKTLITHIDDGFDFLGWNFRKYKGKLLIKPSQKSIKSITQKLKTIVSKAKTWIQDELIKTLNPVIRGWANYHRHIVAKETFQKLDSYLWEITWQWGKRRHPNKGHKWIANKYWTSEGTRKWVFKTKENKLLKFSDTKIRRHHHAKLDANPYLNKNYFLERKDRIKKHTPWIQTKLPFFV